MKHCDSKSVDKEKIEIIIILFARTYVNKSKQRYYRIKHVQITSATKALFHLWYIIFLFVQQSCQNITRTLEISSISLVY